MIDVPAPASVVGPKGLGALRRRRLRVDPTVVRREREIVDAATGTGEVDSPQTAALAAFAAALGWAVRDHREALIAATTTSAPPG